jgi:hypothetical protein
VKWGSHSHPAESRSKLRPPKATPDAAPESADGEGLGGRNLWYALAGPREMRLGWAEPQRQGRWLPPRQRGQLPPRSSCCCCCCCWGRRLVRDQALHTVQSPKRLSCSSQPRRLAAASGSTALITQAGRRGRRLGPPSGNAFVAVAGTHLRSRCKVHSEANSQGPTWDGSKVQLTVATHAWPARKNRGMAGGSRGRMARLGSGPWRSTASSAPLARFQVQAWWCAVKRNSNRPEPLLLGVGNVPNASARGQRAAA